MSGGWAALAALVPAPSGGGGLDAALDSPLGVLLRPLGDTPQEPRWHGEGDVLTHTRLVLEALEAAPEFWALDVERRAALWLAALLHDVGKAACTRLEGGAWTSPHHGQAGARLVRALLWREYGLAGEARGRGCGSSSARSYAITPRPRTSLRPRTLSGGSAPRGPGRARAAFSLPSC